MTSFKLSVEPYISSEPLTDEIYIHCSFVLSNTFLVVHKQHVSYPYRRPFYHGFTATRASPIVEREEQGPFQVTPPSLNYYPDVDLTPSSNMAASYYSEPWQKHIVQVTSSFLLSHLTWIGVDFLSPPFESSTPNPNSQAKTIKFLDYACGPGTLTSIFKPFITSAIGLDVSEKMVEAYNARFFEADQPKANAEAFTVDIPPPPTTAPSWTTDPQFQSFDFVAVGYAFHHFDNLPLYTSRLVQRLKPGSGVFMIIDLLDEGSEPSHSHSHHHHHNDPAHPIHPGGSVQETISHPHGFSRSRVHELFQGAGLTDIKMEVLDEKIYFEKKGKEGEEGVRIEKTVFVARGRRGGVAGENCEEGRGETRENENDILTIFAMQLIL